MQDFSQLSVVLVIFSALISIGLAIMFLLWIYNKLVEIMGMKNSKWNFLKDGMGAFGNFAAPLAGAALLGIILMAPVMGASASPAALGVQTQYEAIGDFAATAKATGLTVGSDYVFWHNADGETTKYYRIFTATSDTYNWRFNPQSDSDGTISVAVQLYNGTVPAQAEAIGATANAYLALVEISEQADTDSFIDMAIVVLLVSIFVGIAFSFSRQS